MKKTIVAEIPGRERVELEFEVDPQGDLRQVSLRGVGGPDLLDLLTRWRIHLRGSLVGVPLPPGNETGAMLVREVLQKAQGRWHYPYTHEELCHCRAVSTLTVDRAVLVGAHTPREVSRLTSASTACGTCRPDVEAIIKFRLGHQPA